ncbi:helix-turn-helix domain-containing protein [Butyrivibrio sp. AE2032]|uniref:helix-turn-helix domain-containing protein n=1 Tax=Butyrivibrio sp. AE2032 TaxID=1458463 RepID=UPI00068AA7EF|nr:helix-turn-helix transcriptional regulator [Butyrivibrio sp. AE2032]
MDHVIDDKERVEVGRRLKEFRKENRLTQQKMASMIGYSSPYYSLIENGKAVNVNQRSFERIAKKLKINKTWLIEGVGEPAVDYVLAVDPFSDNIMIETEDHGVPLSSQTSRETLYTMLLNLPKLNTDELELLIDFAKTQKEMKQTEQNRLSE